MLAAFQRGGKTLLRQLRNPHLIVLLAAVGVYSYYWSSVTVSKYYGLGASVYDLGLFMQHTWMFTQPESVALYGTPSLSGPIGYLALVVDQPIEFLLSPMALLGSYPAVLILQTVALGSAALPLYLVARRIIGSDFPALSLSIAFLLYVPLDGVNWFDAHFVAFFVPLFLWGFLFFLQRSFRLAALLLLAAGATEFPSVALVALFAATILLELALGKWRFGRVFDPGRFKFAILLLVAAVVFFLYQFLFLNSQLGAQSLAETIHTGGSGGLAISSSPIPLTNRIEVIALILIPVLFLPLLSPRWLIMLVPIVYLVFGTTYFGYSYPTIFRTQYSATYIRFVFLGAVYGVQWLSNRYSSSVPEVQSHLSRRRQYLRRLTRPSSVAVAVLIAGVSVGCLYAPYGPLNHLTGPIYSIPTVNMSTFQSLEQLESLIPRSSPYVLFQNDMPGILPRPLEYGDTPLVTGLGDWQNVTLYDAHVGSFPYKLFNGTVVDARVDYAIDNPHNWGFTQMGNTPDNSMYYFVRALFGSGSYGILGEMNGMMVLERNYSGAPALYEPYSARYPATSLYLIATHSRPTSQVISGTNLQNATLWYGPYATLSPGAYRVNSR